MNLREAAQQALEALNSVEWYGAGSGWMVDADAIEKSITALRNALAEQRLTDMEQEMERSIASLKAALAEPVQDGKCQLCTDGCPACDARKLADQLLEDQIVYGTAILQGGKRVDPMSIYKDLEKRMPLTEEEIRDLWTAETKPVRYTSEMVNAFARAIERAHGIGGEDK